MIVRIEDPDDPRIEPYRAVRDRDVAGRGERFVAEGEVVLRVLLTRSRFAVESLLLAENRVDAVAPLLARLDPAVPVYVAGRQAMDAIVGFPIHRGVLAIGLRGPELPVDAFLGRLPHEALVIGLVGLANHDNVGGIFRNAAAFGAQAVLLDEGTCDPLYRKAIRVSVGGALVVPFVRAGTATAMCEALAAADFEPIALSPAGAEDLTEIRPGRRTALLLGAEGPGLPPEVLARCRTVRIRMADGFDSLNVATASGIALHHFAGARLAGL